jgi:hypothetical protein
MTRGGECEDCDLVSIIAIFGWLLEGIFGRGVYVRMSLDAFWPLLTP